MGLQWCRFVLLCALFQKLTFGFRLTKTSLQKHPRFLMQKNVGSRNHGGMLQMGISETLVQSGVLIAYETKGGKSVSYGVIEGKDGKNIKVHDENGKLINVSMKQTLHGISLEAGPLKPSQLARVVAGAGERADAALLELAWEMLAEEAAGEDGAAAVTPEALCDLMFGDGGGGEEGAAAAAAGGGGGGEPAAVAAGARWAAAVGLLLSEEGRCYFSVKKSARAGLAAEPKLAGVVQSLREALALEEERREQRKQEELAEQLRQQRLVMLMREGLKNNKDFTTVCEEAGGLSAQDQQDLEDLKTSAARSAGKEEQGREDAVGKRVLEGLGRVPSRTNAFKLCVQLGLFSKHENLLLHGTLFAAPPDEEVRAAVEAFVANPPADPDAAIRKDLTHLKVYTVDSADTFEVDDGLSVETLEDGTERLWIHIADASRWVARGDALERHAARRATTVYLPDRVLPMFPGEVARRMSLLPGQLSYAMSCCVRLNEDGSILSVDEVTPSTIQVTYKITYEDVVEMEYAGVLSTEEKELGRLLHYACTRRDYRASKGSLDANNPKPPEDKVTVKKNDEAQDGFEVHFEGSDINTSSYLMVTELMILAGEAVAWYAHDRKIVIPFRSQRQPEDLPDPEFFEALPRQYCRAQAFFRFMKPAVVSIHPEPHAGLALDQYVQWSSPIRRYSDLIVHYQLKAHLHSAAAEGAAPAALGTQEVLAETAALEGTLKHASQIDVPSVMVQFGTPPSSLKQIMGRSRRYWQYEFFRRNIGKVFEAYVLAVWDQREYGGRLTYTLLLPDLGAKIPYQMNEMALELGSTGKLQIIDANPRANILQTKYFEGE